MKRILVIALALLLLCGCAQPKTDAITSFGADIMLEAERAVFFYDVESRRAEHGEDAVIEWQDPGIETIMRILLDRSEGEIRRSDVWDIQILDVNRVSGYMLTELPAGAQTFHEWDLMTRADLTRVSIEDSEIPAIRSLEDLRHFDSLQVLSLMEVLDERAVLELQPLNSCRELRMLRMQDTAVANLAPLAQLTQLQNLYLRNCGELDLTPLENHPALSVVRVGECRLPTLEPLTTMPNLRYLSLGWEAEYPGLEPLTRTSLEYLELDLSIDGRELYAGLDYETLEKIPNLVCLSMLNHTHFDLEQCRSLIQNCPKLKYLDICYTTAAKEIAEGGILDVSGLEAFLCMNAH